MFERDYFLKKHGIVLDTNKSVEEQILKMTVGFGVQDSVSDDRPYIFISYAHKDSAIVLPAIKALQDKGYPVWYDAGIRPGTTWSDYIADHVRDAALVIAFMSKNAIESHHCQSEIRYAFNNGRPMLTVMLDQSRLPSGLDMQLSHWQMFHAYSFDAETYISKLAGEPFISKTVNGLLDIYSEQKRKESKRQEQLISELQSRLSNMEADTERREEILGIPLKAEEAKKQLDEMYEYVRENLLEKEPYGYKLAMLYIEDHMRVLAKFNPSLQADMEYYEASIRKIVYQEARILEKRKNYKDALERYDALGEAYLDSRQRLDSISLKQKKRYKNWLSFVAVVYCVMHFLMIRCFDSHTAWIWVVAGGYTFPTITAFLTFWYGDFVYFGLLERDYKHMRHTNIAVVVAILVISIFIDSFVFSTTTVWQLILGSLCFSVIGVVSGALLLGIMFSVLV